MSESETNSNRSGSKRHRPVDSDSACPSCAEEVTDDGVECQWCSCWEHYKCAGISQGEYNMLSINSPCIMFFCCKCQPKVGIALEFFNKMSSRQDLFDKRLQSIEQKLNSLTQVACDVQESDEMSTDAHETSAQPRAGILPRVESLSAGSISTAVTSALSEERDKEKRKLNLIVHNTVEPTAEDGQARKKQDIDNISRIFQKNLGVNVKVTNALRLGKKGDKPRLLKITMDSEQSKASVLRNCTKLRGSGVPQSLAKVFITPDMTPKEREHNKSLRAQLAEMNKNGKSFRIKNGKIVRKNN